MLIKFKEKEMQVKEELINTIISHSTGKELTTYNINIEATGEDQFKTMEELIKDCKEDGVVEVEDGKEVRAFDIGAWSYKYRNDFRLSDTIYTFAIDLIEKERLYTNTITIAGIEYQVLKYEEEYNKEKNAIIITVIVKTTEEEREKMIEVIGDQKYFEVIRNDIDKKPTIMRFGMNFWSKHDGYIKRKLTLVGKEYDDTKSSNVFKGLVPEISKMRELVAQNTQYIQVLEEILLKKEYLTKDEIDEIHEKVGKDYTKVMRQYYLVDDVEDED